jgi:hypothetical protein
MAIGNPAGDYTQGMSPPVPGMPPNMFGGGGSAQAATAPVPGALPPTPGQGGIGSDYASVANTGASGSMTPGTPAASFNVGPTGPIPGQTIGHAPIPVAQPPSLAASSAGPGGQLMAQPAPKMPVQTTAAPIAGSPGGGNSFVADGLAKAFGLNPNSVQQALAGIGRGMTAAGNAPRGTPAGQMFARGLGGAATGTYDAGQQSQNQAMAQNAATAKQAMDLAQMQELQQRGGLINAQTGLTNSQTNSINAGQGRYGVGGSNAPSNNPYNRYLRASDQIRKQEADLRANYTKQGMAPDDVETRVAKDMATYKQQIYRGAGLDPNQADKIAQTGIEPPQTPDGKANPNFQPFDVRKMPGGLNEWNQTVPVGRYYLDQNGKPQLRQLGPGQDYVDKATGKTMTLPPLPGAQQQQQVPQQQYQPNPYMTYMTNSLINSPLQ